MVNRTHNDMYNVTCPHNTGKGLKLTSVPFNKKKASKYADWHKLPGNEGHLAWMAKAEIACAAELLKLPLPAAHLLSGTSC